MEDFKKNKSMGIIEASTYSILCGVAISVIFPGSILYGFIMNAIGVGGIGYYALSWSKFDQLFKNLQLGKENCYPIQKSKTKTEFSTVYKFTLPAGLCLEDFEDNKEAIENFLGKDIEIRYTFKEIEIEVYNNSISSNIPYKTQEIDGYVPIVFGLDRTNKLVSCDLGNGEPHLLIAGETGSGKSTVLRSIITNLILTTKIKLHLVDLKMGTEFNVFQKSSHVATFSRTITEAEQVLADLDNEVVRRYQLFYEKDVKDIVQYNKRYKKNKLGYEVVIIDEFADLQNSKTAKFELDELGRKARACGIHMILSTQRPDAKVLSGNIKSNVTNVLGLKTLNSTNSHIILDDTGLEKLRGNGHAIFKRRGTTELQCFNLSVDECKKLIKDTYVKKTPVKIEPVIKDFSFMEDL